MLLTRQISSLSFSIHIICLASLQQRLIGSKFLLLLPVSTFGLPGTKLITMALSRMLLAYLLLSTGLLWSTILRGQPNMKKLLQSRKSPYPPYFKINYDTAIRSTFSTQAAVCRDSIGSIIKCISLISSPCSPLYGEALGALLIARLATSLGLSSFILEGDSLNVTLALQHPATTTNW
jgi:hypothetical protein